MTLLLSSATLGARRSVTSGELGSLANGLLVELEPLLNRTPEIPTAKAHLSRVGGRCDRDGTLLTYDPFDPRHRCPTCGRELVGEEHDRFRLYWHHLWLAERAVHAALLGELLDHPGCRALAAALLEGYAATYLRYPNRDNVLGPSRPFFSTYLESIWLLQLTIALDLLESGTRADHYGALGSAVREQLIAPSAALIASYDEGTSNRQVWNDAALIAAGTLLADERMVEQAVDGASGLFALLSTALLDDGSWYEGENYHLFAHRGLWYGVQMVETRGITLPRELTRRFGEGFAAPFRTILPDLTYPSRRDSQYAVSIRQPRFAESCELGLARGDDDRLTSILARLYDPAIPRGDSGRVATAADVERNGPATGLSRSDLSWRSLLLARPSLPPLRALPIESDLLPAQGYGILRRKEGLLYAALDYGHSGGGHGHPDRLNVILVDGDARWFDDPGTGSYVDPTLHWYRSTLAHTAPLIDGRSQPRANGTLRAFDVGDVAGWVRAEVSFLPDLLVRRTLVALDDYLVDIVDWAGDAMHEVALPWHGFDLVDEQGTPLPRSAGEMTGGRAADDGFAYLSGSARIDTLSGEHVRAIGGRNSSNGEHQLHAWISCDGPASWWSSTSPDVPGVAGRATLLLARHAALKGRFIAVWSWGGHVSDVRFSAARVTVLRGTSENDVHQWDDDEWRMERVDDERVMPIVLRGSAHVSRATSESISSNVSEHRELLSIPAHFVMGEREYRRSEESWEEAGQPSARVEVELEGQRTLHVSVIISPSGRHFVDIDADNPLDNEPAAINGDGVQLYVETGPRRAGWLLVPVRGTRTVAARPVEEWGDGLELVAEWKETTDGWSLDARVSLPTVTADFRLDVLVNETAPGRERRRGQLVLSGANGEFVYLRGDRHDPERLLHFVIADA